ncbi:hypothetical protein [Mycolicibacterium baixiangningiae]|uniref:hypothetical protein n=1 Tax=Mycolicibacterium baixiangningiae TaxID=2761578 RepID=UPI0018677535|nr:hypothetical protein [Mycolicibacterium baixiangningiae]
MAIEQLLSVDVPEGHMPVTAQMQELITTALAEDPDNSGDSPLLAVLALAIYRLEGRLFATQAEILKVHHALLNLRAHTVDLESRIIEAGFDLPPIEFELEPVETLFAPEDD